MRLLACYLTRLLTGGAGDGQFSHVAWVVPDMSPGKHMLHVTVERAQASTSAAQPRTLYDGDSKCVMPKDAHGRSI
jgi:hypothetical protein